MTKPKVLVLAIGNPSRGDDALGPLLCDRLVDALGAAIERGGLEVLTDFQLQIEHVLDIEDRDRVYFVDASVRATAPFELTRVFPRPSHSFSTHALAPEALLEVYRTTLGAPPEAWVMAIRGERFELGAPLSERASAHLEAALDRLLDELRQSRAPSDGGRRFDVEGIVQGVGFRPWVHRTALGLGLRGKVWNTPFGVAIEASGPQAALDALMHAIQNAPPEPSEVRSVRLTPMVAVARTTFSIEPSEQAARSAMALPPDLAACVACLRDVANPGSRHYGYAFTTCSNCGPRLSISRSLPYDRATTTMESFAPCTSCAAEYMMPENRRFHAQTIACPTCGPRVWLALTEDDTLVSEDAIAAAAALLLEGEIVATKGLGAFHLVCDATNTTAVRALRKNKRRDEQPFAVMVADVRAGEEIAVLDETARAALSSTQRPIVLVPSREGGVVPEVCGPSRRTGLMLPYTPLHWLLSKAVARPLVFTSGNASGGPAIVDDIEARRTLGKLAKGILFHDRGIERRIEDSVVSIAPSGMRVVRRARGFAPKPIRLPICSPEPVLALGGHAKNTACVVVGDLAYMTSHLGDLTLLESESAWKSEVAGFEALLGVHAEVLAHDLHPEYSSTRFALARPARRRVGVQHHLAHVLAAIAEHRLEEPVVGVVYDGSGFGLDGTAWGAEILVVDGASFTRASSFRPVLLPGGELAIRDVWRVALAMLADAFGPHEARAMTSRFAAFDGIASATIETVTRMIETGAVTVRARGMGRWFDAFGALILGLPRASFDGHVAIALEEASDERRVEPYAVALPSALSLSETLDERHEIDLRPTVRVAVGDLLSGTDKGLVAARFHQTIVRATSAVVAQVLAATGLRRVVLSGGSFQNRILERGVLGHLGSERVIMARDVPMNDGGISLGQALAAVLALNSSSGKG
jgi:hydrogenase maturation protein HypF